MSTPHGMRCVPKTLATGDKVHIYGDTARIILQIRHQVPSEENLLEPSFCCEHHVFHCTTPCFRMSTCSWFAIVLFQLSLHICSFSTSAKIKREWKDRFCSVVFCCKST